MASIHNDGSTLTHSAPDFAEVVDAQLDRLAKLPPNWDAQGAPVIEPEIIAAARRFVGRLPAEAPNPAVVPLARGSLQLEWNRGSRSLELEFESPTSIRYLKWHPQEGVEAEESFSVEDIAQAELLIRWFMRGAS
jgi:hypothetical protein